MPLTGAAITKAKPTEKQYPMAHERGLVLLVRTNCSLHFRQIPNEYGPSGPFFVSTHQFTHH
jgi:hypothetical protein